MIEPRPIFDEFASGMLRVRGLDLSERQADWSAAVKRRLLLTGKRRGYVSLANDDRRRSGSYVWDVAWCDEGAARRRSQKWAGIPNLAFPLRPYRALVLAAEVEWGKPGIRRNTAVWRQNMEEVFRDFYKLLDARSSLKIMVYSSWRYPDQGGRHGHFLRGFQQLLRDYQGHQGGERYLFFEFQDRTRQLCGWHTQVQKRGSRPFHMRSLGSYDYPRSWS